MEDMSSLSSPRCWGRHLGMLGKTIGDVGEDRNIGKDMEDEEDIAGLPCLCLSRLKAIGEDIKEDGDHTGEVRDDGEDIRDDGEDIGEVREDEEDIAGLPCLCLKMSWKPCLPYLP